MHRRLLPLVLAALLLAAGCGFFRNTGTPSARLVGHWFTDNDDHLYFGRTVNDVGTLIVLRSGGTVENLVYEVIEEDAEAETVTVTVTLEDESQETRVYRIPPDALFMREQTEDAPDEEKTEYIYIDYQTEPAIYTQTEVAQ